MGIIYKAIHKANRNEIYIGRTASSLEDRRRSHERNQSVWSLPETAFDRVLIHTGINNWEWEILQDQLTDDLELDSAERKHIQAHLNKGYKLHNIAHNPDHPNSKTERKQKDSSLGAARAWDPLNTHANHARYYSKKIIPIVNLTKNVKYENITSCRDSEDITTVLIHKLCKSGEPHPRTGNQYAFLDISGEPILNDGHSKEYLIQQKIEILNILTSEITRCSLVEAADKINCRLNVLTAMKQLCISGRRNDVSCNGFLVFAIDADENRIETDEHKHILWKINDTSKVYYVWKWNSAKSEWKYEKKLNGIDACADLFATTLGNKSNSYKSKLSEIIQGKRHHINGYTVTTTSDLPISKPLLKNQSVIWLDAGNGKSNLFIDVKQASVELNINRNSILECCRGSIYSTAGKRFVFADENNEPIYTERHIAYSRNAFGAGKSVFWVQGDESFKSISALRIRLLELWKSGDKRIGFVPKNTRLSKILKGEESDEFGTDQTKFKITLRQIN
jgi:hypothetical protein